MDTMQRRDFIKAGGALLAGAVWGPHFARAASTDVNIITPTKAQQTWQDCEIGLVYHFDMAIAAGDFTSNNTQRKPFNPRLYNPVKLDTDQWIEAAKAVGAKYAVFTATHFNGFMQWQSDLYPYGVKQAAWRDGKGDVVGDFVESCRKAGILPGVYMSTHRNAYQTVWGHYVNWGKGRGTPEQERYNRIAEQQVKELCSRYGDLVQIWFDAGVKTPQQGGPDVLPVFEKYQPNSVFYHSGDRSDHRWVGNEQGTVSYPCWATMPGKEGGSLSHNSRGWRGMLGKGDPNGTAWSPGMCDTPLRGHNWFWKPGQDNRVRSLDWLIDRYYKSVGRNCNLLLGEVVTSEGLVPEHDIRRLAQFGQEVKRLFGAPLAETSGSGKVLRLDLPRPGQIDHIVAMEDIALGERVRRFTLEGLVAGNEWIELGEGSCIGHKRIERVPPTEVAAVRLRVDESLAQPHIRSLSAYSASA